MPEPLRPFRNDRYAIGTSGDGRPLAICAMTSSAADELGPRAAAIGPWVHYGFDAGRLTAALKGATNGALRFQIECGGDLAGAAVILSPWLAGPYLQMLVVLPEYQRQGVGAAVLAWLEAEARDHFRNLWLCVSAFNIEAQRFYGAHGFECVAKIDSLVREGDDELLMRKLIVRR